MKSTIELEDKLHLKVKEYCKDNGYSVNGLIRVLLIQKIGDI